MEVRGAGSAWGAGPVGRVNSVQATPTESVATAQVAGDQVEISEAARALLESSGGVADARAARLEQIRAAIADGSYDTPEKLTLAVDRMLAEWVSPAVGSDT